VARRVLRRPKDMKIRDISITVRTLGQQSCYLTVSENDLAESLKIHFEKAFGIPMKNQRVWYEGVNGFCEDFKPGRRLKDFVWRQQPPQIVVGKLMPPKPKGRPPKFRKVHPLPPMPKFPPPAPQDSRAIDDAERRVDKVLSSPRPPNRQVPVPKRDTGTESDGRRLTPTAKPVGMKALQVPKPSSTCSTATTSAGTASLGAPSCGIHHSKSWSPAPMSGGATPKVPESFHEMATSRTKRAGTPGAPANVSTLSQHSPAGVARIRRTDLQRVGRLGVGAFGLVTLEADKRTGRTYALKAVSKGYLAHLRMEYSVLNEKRILKMLDTPFVVRLLATYNGREHVYFLLEAALGGELFTTYERLKLYGSEVHARFYVACVTEALTHLHEKNVIYRDLKPENLLLDVKGFCKVTDMGLAKITTSPTFTMVGTPDYMAPEVIDQTGHTKSVDWWTLGVLLFELLAGHAPFESKTGNAQETYGLVKRGIETVHFPGTVNLQAAALVRNLCHRNPEVRLRTPLLREHAFFKSFDWPGLQALRMTPPLVPQVRGPRDLSNFRDCEHEDPQAMPYQDTGSGWDFGFEDDVLSAGASAAAAAAPLLPLPTQGTHGAKISTPTRGAVAPPPNQQSYRPITAPLVAAQPLTQRRLGSPECSPRGASQSRQYPPRQAGPSNARTPAPAWQAHAVHTAVSPQGERKMTPGASCMTRQQSPATSPILGGG